MRVGSGEQVFGYQEQISLEVQDLMQQGKGQREALRSVCMKWTAQIQRSLMVTENDKRAVVWGIEGMSPESRADLIRVYDALLRNLRYDMQQVRSYERGAFRVVARTID